MSSPVLSKSDLFQGLSVLPLRAYGLLNAINFYRINKKRSLWYNLLVGFGIISSAPYLICQLIFLFFTDFNLKSLISVYLNLVPAIQLLLKSSVFWYRIEDEGTLYDLLKENFFTSVKKEKKEIVRGIYRQVAKWCNIGCLIVFTAHTAVLISWISTPAFPTGGARNKVIAAWYPFSYSESPMFEVIFYYEVALLLFYGTMLTMYECITIQQLVGLYTQFLVLRHHISSLKAKDILHGGNQDELLKSEVNDYLNGEFEHILNDYSKLLRYSELTKDVFNFLLTVILGSDTAVMVIVTMFLLFFGEENSILAFQILCYLSYGIVEVSLICIISSLLETVSSDIRFAAYSSDWYIADKKYRYSVLMMMIRARQPTTLVAVKLYPINMEVLIKIFQFIYTTITVLLNVKK